MKENGIMVERNKLGQFEKGYHPPTAFRKGHKGYWLNKKRPNFKLPHYFKKGNIPWNKGKSFLAVRGKKHWQWKGGVRKSSGYVWILNPSHPFAKDRYVPRARLVAEKCLGRYLSRKEIIHHINEITNDDRPENLYLFPTKVTHLYFHRLKNKPKLVSNLIKNVS